MMKHEFLDRIEHFDLVTQSAELLAFITHEGPKFRDTLTHEEATWVADHASTASMTLGLQQDNHAASHSGRAVAASS
jgi:hypothetical protein